MLFCSMSLRAADWRAVGNAETIVTREVFCCTEGTIVRIVSILNCWEKMFLCSWPYKCHYQLVSKVVFSGLCVSEAPLLYAWYCRLAGQTLMGNSNWYPTISRSICVLDDDWTENVRCLQKSPLHVDEQCHSPGHVPMSQRAWALCDTFLSPTCKDHIGSPLHTSSACTLSLETFSSLV